MAFQEIEIVVRAHGKTFSHDVIVEILVLERHAVIGEIVRMLPFFVAESLVVETEQNAVRMAGDQVVNVVGMPINVSPEKIKLHIGVPILLASHLQRQKQTCDEYPHFQRKAQRYSFWPIAKENFRTRHAFLGHRKERRKILYLTARNGPDV